MTLITRLDGSPYRALFMPDDDNTLTVIKGDSRGAVSSWIEAAGESRASIIYRLDSGVGKIIGIPVAIEDTEIGDEIPGASFEGFQDTLGPVRLIRRL